MNKYSTDRDYSDVIEMYIDNFKMETDLVTCRALLVTTKQVNSKLYGDKRKDYNWTNQIVQLTKNEDDLGNIIIANSLMKQFLKENLELAFNILSELQLKNKELKYNKWKK